MTPQWTSSKTNLLRAIDNANFAKRHFPISDFNRQDVQWFALEGWVSMGLRGPVLTAAGLRKLKAVTQ